MKIIILLTLLSSNLLLSQSFVPNAPELNLKSYMLIESNTNTVIAESNSDGLVEPASMTKVMTAYVVADQIKNDLISIDDKVLISEKAWKWADQKCLLRLVKELAS